MEQNEKCIAKWEKRIAKAEDGKKRWGQSYGFTWDLEIKIYKEVVKDLKRLCITQNPKG